MTVKEKRDIKRKLNVINYAKKTGNVSGVVTIVVLGVIIGRYIPGRRWKKC